MTEVTRAQRQQALEQVAEQVLNAVAGLRMPDFSLEDEDEDLMWRGNEGFTSFVVLRLKDRARFGVSVELTITKLPPR